MFKYLFAKGTHPWNIWYEHVAENAHYLSTAQFVIDNLFHGIRAFNHLQI